MAIFLLVVGATTVLLGRSLIKTEMFRIQGFFGTEEFRRQQHYSQMGMSFWPGAELRPELGKFIAQQVPSPVPAALVVREPAEHPL
jgi:hypothetical protein